jgi:hypothetical protein
MDEKKQIEKMALDICKSRGLCLVDNCRKCSAHGNCLYQEIAYGLYNTGYREQSEGEWKEVYRNNQATVYECTNCNHLSFGTSDYCICGAKMKGGAE